MTLPDKATGSVAQQEFQWDGSDNEDAADSSISTPPPGTKLQGKTITARFVQGTTVVFDSFSNEKDVQRRNHAAINISKINDTSKRFATDFTVRTSGQVTAVLSPSTVANYRVVDPKRGSRPQPLIPSFSSIISNGVISQSDRDLASSLAACASSASPVDSEAPNDENHARTEQLRKRCRTMLQQRGGRLHVEEEEGEDTSSGMVNNKKRISVGTPPPSLSVGNTLDSDGHNTPTSTAAGVTHTVLPDCFFFAPVLRPIAVEQALHKYYERRDIHGLACNGGRGGAGETPGRFIRTAQHITSTMSDGVGDVQRLGISTTMPTAGTTVSPSAFSAAAKLWPSPGSILMSHPSLSAMMNGGSKHTILPPLSFQVPDGNRVSSSELIFAAMVCPVPVNGLLNLSDINFDNTSDEIVTLTAAWK
jgi:hypothetical protein